MHNRNVRYYRTYKELKLDNEEANKSIAKTGYYRTYKELKLKGEVDMIENMSPSYYRTYKELKRGNW